MSDYTQDVRIDTLQRDGARAWEIVNRRLDDMIYEGLRLP